MTTTERLTYRVAGTTDDVTQCDTCGRDELKGTVRLELVDGEGNVHGEVFSGTSCAAQLAGRKAQTIRTEAARADRAREAATRELHAAYRDARHAVTYAAEQAWMDERGVQRTFATMCEARDDAGVQAAIAEWDAEHPKPW